MEHINSNHLLLSLSLLIQIFLFIFAIAVFSKEATPCACDFVYANGFYNNKIHMSKRDERLFDAPYTFQNGSSYTDQRLFWLFKLWLNVITMGFDAGFQLINNTYK